MLGLANDSEVAEIEALYSQYPEIKTAVNDFASELERQALENALAPPPEMKAKVLAALNFDVSAAPVVDMPGDTTKDTGATVYNLKRWRMLAAASVILLVGSAALNFYFYNRFDEKNKAYQALLTERNTLFANNQVFQTHLNEYRSALEMMADPAMLMVKMKGVPHQKNSMATIFWDTRNKDVYVVPNKLPDVLQGKQYQLWAIVDGKPIDAGTLDTGCEGVCKMKNIPRAEAFAITLEKAGGSPSPTMEEMYVMGVI